MVYKAEETEIEKLRVKYTITDEIKNIYEQTKSERQNIEINLEEIEGQFHENYVKQPSASIERERNMKIVHSNGVEEIMNVVKEYNNNDLVK